MKVLNTKYESAGRVVLEDALKGIKVARNDRDYTKYDTAIFMSPDSEVKYAKSINPKIKCIIFDPKTNNLEDVRLADELIVSSIEQREFFLKYNQNIKIYYMFPPVPKLETKHERHSSFVVCYHGNKQHLEEMTELTQALDELAKEYPIKLWVVYNIKKLGKWTKNHPKVCPVQHIDWSKTNLNLTASASDIGVVPSLKPTWKLNNDYVSRYKYSNNPGRIWVFSQLGIPVIADFTPSSCQIIKDGHNGLLVGTKEGWIRAIKMLFDVELRNKLSYNLRRELKKSPNPFK
jgi:glycosyltransferase involved in cell wall biosynthesis